jgi:hypothetical protein
MSETVPMPDVVGYCKVCAQVEPFTDSHYFIVSPHGIAHHGDSWGSTACGHDATGERWWWPL